MKSTALLACLALLPAAFLNAQLNLTPQIGIESSKSTLIYNSGSSFAPLGSMANINASLRLYYNIKKAGGPYLSVGTSPGTVAFSFTDPATALNNFEATASGLKWKIESGYQFTSKPIALESPKSSAASVKQNITEYPQHHRCGGYRQQLQKVPSTLNMRIQPSVGIAYRPTIDDATTEQPYGYQFNAGAWKTAVVGGLGFQFEKGKRELGTVSLYYTKGIATPGTTLNSSVNGKNTTTQFSSASSSWALTFGLPFNLSKTQKVIKETYSPYRKHEYHRQCNYSHYRCSKGTLN